MSLLERAEQLSEPEVVQGEAAAVIDELNNRVQAIISADEVAKMMAESPVRAQSELRAVCRSVLNTRAFSSLNKEQQAELEQAMVNRMFGFGPIEELLNDALITEIMINGTASIYYEQAGRLHRSPKTFRSEEQLRALIDRILGPLGKRIDESSPMVDARLPQGHRVNAVIPPIVLDGPIVTIRKFTEHVITLAEMEHLRTVTPELRQFLIWTVQLRKSIAVSGGTGSGKTTLLNALSCEIPPSERIVTIEDSAELRFLEHPHVVRMEARPKNAEGIGQITIRDLVTNALRMRPDRIVVGEVRGAEAFDMLQAMLTGHDGSLTTLHANSPAEVVPRLTAMVRYEANLPVDVIEQYIASALDLVVQIVRDVSGDRYIAQVVSLAWNKEARTYAIEEIYTRKGVNDQGKWTNLPEWLDQLVENNVATKEEVRAWSGRLYCAR